MRTWTRWVWRWAWRHDWATDVLVLGGLALCAVALSEMWEPLWKLFLGAAMLTVGVLRVRR